MALEPGTRLGPYEIVELRGRGGMGEVYRARDTRLDRDVALKVLRAELSEDETYRRRLEREAKTISRLQHPHVCMLLDVGSEAGNDYLVMEYLEGQTLEDRLRKGPLPPAEMLRIGREIAEAIEAAHRRGIVHRDLKPGNVMLTATGTKVLDFGLARTAAGSGAPIDTQAMMASAITVEGIIVGTMPYMAPEQLQGSPADARTDIWALGAGCRDRARCDRGNELGRFGVPAGDGDLGLAEPVRRSAARGETTSSLHAAVDLVVSRRRRGARRGRALVVPRREG